MTIRKLHLVAGLAILAVTVSGASGADKGKTQEITIGDLKLTVPASWKSVKPRSSILKGQIEVPAAKGDKQKGTITVSSFPGGGGSLSQNLARWHGEFAPKGRKTKSVKGNSTLGDYVLANITGTHRGTTFRPRKPPLENARLVVFRLELKKAKKIYYLKIAAEDKTAASVVEPLRTAIGADKKSEKPLEE